jgi:diketogulonate reductase-like aldo/keto reductase
MQDPLLIKLAKKYKVSVAQICIRWCLQHNVIPLPKSTHKQRIKDNFNVFKFKISETDMKLIDKNRYRTRIFPDPNKGK